MDCNTARWYGWFVRPGAAELEPAEVQALAAHLEECPDCRCQAREETRWHRHLAAVIKDVPIPAGFRSNLLTVLANERNAQQMQALRRWTFWTAGVAAAALLIGLAVWWRMTPPPRPPTVIGIDELAATPRYWIPQGQPEVNLLAVKDWFHQRGHEVEFPREFARLLRIETLDGASFTALYKDSHLVLVPTMILRKGRLQARVFLLHTSDANPDELTEIRQHQAAYPRSAERWIMGGIAAENEVFVACIIFDVGRYEDFFLPPQPNKK
jgi:hypothetical protein